MRKFKPLIAAVLAFGTLAAIPAAEASAAQTCSISKVPVTRTEHIKVTKIVKGKKVIKLETKKVDVRINKKVRVKVKGKWKIEIRSVIKYRSVQSCITLAAPVVAAPVVAPVSGTAPVPSTVSYKAAVDPTFVQSPTNPLAVTFDYSADAVQTQGSINTDLAQVGELPAGILDLFSDGGLACSINVGDTTSSGACPVTYAATGAHTIVTEYIPNGASAVTQTEVDTIQPFSTTTTATVSHTVITVTSITETVGIAIADQNGNAISALSGAGTITIADSANPSLTTTYSTMALSSCAWSVDLSTNYIFSNNLGAGGNKDCSGPQTLIIPRADELAGDITFTASYVGAAGYSASTSVPIQN